jgi:stalled ribosome rescue protein Dom34
MRGIYKTISYKHKFMTTATNLGIWMDHSNAHLMEFTTEPLTTMIISSRFTHREKVHSVGRSENGMHQKEQHEHLDYYKKIGEAIKNYQDVLLFGPTAAKTELFNLLKADHHFEKIRIETKDADKMTQNEQHAFVRNHFSRH